VYLYDTTGRRYIDAAGGALVVNIGHGVSDIAETMASQAKRVAFAHATQFTSEPLETYTSALSDVVQLPDPKVYLVSGGSEAVETALKLARQICVARGDAGRYKIVSRWGSYHGATLGALSASGRPPLRLPYAPLLIDFPHIPPAYCYRCPFGRKDETPQPQAACPCALPCVDALETEILRQGPETVAAFIAEPVVGATLAAVVPPPDYWPRVRDICDRFGVLLIADEVMTGFGRTGRWFGVDHWQVSPDILVSAKGASGGYFPLGVVVVKGALVDGVRKGAGDFRHGFTNANGVMGAAVGLKVLEHLQSRELVAASARQGEAMLHRLQSLRELRAVGDVRGLGLMAGVELVSEKASRAPYARSARVAERVQAASLARGVNVYCCTGLAGGVDGDAILLGPPFIVTDHQLDEIAGVLREAIAEVTC
jgi:adenosylmethionine-8-amino-7-oxononanoate aminotransferase